MNSVATQYGDRSPGLWPCCCSWFSPICTNKADNPYFRAWQVGWGLYTLYFGMDAWNVYHEPSPLVYFVASLLMVGMALCLFVSTRLMRENYQPHWDEAALGVVGIGLAGWNLREHMAAEAQSGATLPHARLEVCIALILLYCSLRFYFYAHQRNSLAFRMLAVSLDCGRR